ncbi:MAG TPA: hypothetical protein VH500_12495 [Nitrososphaeraceae archaeon]
MPFDTSALQLLILDIKMLEMSGFPFYREIKKLDKRMKVCFLTAGEINYGEYSDILSSTRQLHSQKPYFFLAERYLLTGERQLRFLYLYNAIDDDKTLTKWAPSLNYPIARQHI